jgi:hypothetical protein
MFSSIRMRAALLAVGLSTTTLFAAPQALSTPRLHHTAPFLGHTLTMSVDGAPPFAAVQLLFNTEAGSFATPYGVLELKRNGVHRIASGTTDATGAWSHDFAVPLDPALAESGAHFQAIVADASAPAGMVLSDAFHGRYLGPRVYAGHDAGLYVLSGTSGAIVADVPFASNQGNPVARHEGKPVFDADVGVGAVMSTPKELLFFDPYFAGVIGTIPFVNDCSRILLLDGTKRAVFVLEVGADPVPPRLHAIDLATRTETGFLDLPYPVERFWCAGEPGIDAFVAEHDASGTSVRRLGLAPLADLGSIHVGDAVSSAFRDLAYASGEAFASTIGFVSFQVPGSLTRVRAGSGGLEADVSALGQQQLALLTAVPALDRMLGWQSLTTMGPSGWLSQVKMHSIRAPSPVEPPVPSAMFLKDIEVDGTTAWILAALDDDGCPYLYRLDTTTWAWTPTSLYWCFRTPDAEVLHDALANQVWVANASEPIAGIRPAITVLDVPSGTTLKIRLAQDARVMHAVPLP